MIKPPAVDINFLWSLRPEQFNAWRRENDFPRLLEFMKSQWKGFIEWQAETGIPDQAFIHLGPSFFLRWSDQTRYVLHVQPDNDVEEWLTNENERTGIQAPLEISQQVNAARLRNSYSFIPYQNWAYKKRYRVHEKGHRERIQIGLWSGDGWHAYLFQTLGLLKLGGSLGAPLLLNGPQLGGRNLQFTNMDFLTIQGGSGSRFVDASFSSMRDVKLVGDFAFWHFHETELHGHRIMTGLQLKDGVFQDFHFTRTNTHLSLERAVFHHSSFKESSLHLAVSSQSKIGNCSGRFDSKKLAAIAGAESLYRSLRDQYSEQRDFENAANYHFSLKYERGRKHLSPVRFMREDIKLKGNRIALSEIFEGYKFGELSKLEAKSLVTEYVKTRLRVLVTPKALWAVITSYFLYIGNFLDRLVWGYGVRPVRTLLSAIGVILTFALVYYVDAESETRGDIIKSLYFSMGSFATMTFNDLYQKASHLRFLVNVEALLGILTLALVIGGLSAKSRET
jgi:hypothetical protein